MKIESNDCPIRQVFKQGYFVIPRFQRPYSWDREQVEEFWADTISEKPEQYFIGSMVFFKLGEDTEDIAVVDGQQRLTTIVTSLCALRDVMSEHGLLALANGLHNIIEKKDVNDRPRFCLKTESSYPFFQECILQKVPQKKDVPAREEEERLRAAYEYAVGRMRQDLEGIKTSSTIKKDGIPGKVEEYLIAVRERLLGLKVIFVLVDNEEDAYTIFETLNTRGKDLRTVDLVKTHFARHLRPENDDVDTLKDRWNPLMEIILSSDASIDPDSFMLHWWLSREDYTTQKMLFKKFRRLVTRENANAVLNSLKADAARYRAILEPVSRRWIGDHGPIKRSLEGFLALGVEQQLPMVFSLIRELDGSGLQPTAVVAALRVIENFHFLGSSITARRSSGGTSMMYASHARGLFRAPTRHAKQKQLSDLKAKLRDRMPTLDEVRLGFNELRFSKNFTKQKKLVRYLLEEFDTTLAPGRPADYSRMTIEHLAPQSGRGLGGDHVASIGNLMLVPATINNNELTNKSFEAKKAILKKRNVPLDPIVSGAATWGAVQIRQRTKWMADQAHGKIWAIK